MTDTIALQKDLHSSHRRTGSCDIYSGVCVVGDGIREQGVGKGLVDMAWAPSFTSDGL